MLHRAAITTNNNRFFDPNQLIIHKVTSQAFTTRPFSSYAVRVFWLRGHPTYIWYSKEAI